MSYPEPYEPGHRQEPLMHHRYWTLWRVLAVAMLTTVLSLAVTGVVSLFATKPTPPAPSTTSTVTDDQYFCGVFAVMQSTMKHAVKSAADGATFLASDEVERASQMRDKLKGWNGADRCERPAAITVPTTYETGFTGKVIRQQWPGGVIGMRQTVADANFDTSQTDTKGLPLLVAYTSLTSPRVVMIDTPRHANTDQVIIVRDESGSASATNTITLKTTTGTIDNTLGSFGITCVNSAFGFCKVYCQENRCVSAGPKP